MLTDTGAPTTEPLDIGTTPSPANGAGGGAGVAIRALGHSFGELRVLEGISLSVPAGGVLGIVGPSGCGKSTLLELVAGLRDPDEGSIAVEGSRYRASDAGRSPEEARPAAAAERLRSCALMPQRDLLLPWLAAIDNAALAPRIAGLSRAESRRSARPLFERLGLAGFESSRPAELSGGMRQRVAFLRTLMAGKPVLLLDEPFASLDAITRAEMQSWLAGVLTVDRHTVLLVTHDVEEALYLSDRVAVLSPRPGRVAAEIEVPEPRREDRAAAVTAPGFGELRQRALKLLGGDGR